MSTTDLRDVATAQAAATATPTPAPGPTRRIRIPRRPRHPQFVLGLVIIGAVVVVSIAAPWISPYDPTAPDAANRYLEPLSSGHFFGTDEQGRDILSRMLWGGRATLLPTFLATTAAALLGSIAGLLAGLSDAWPSAFFMRVVDVLFAFPVVIIALALAEILGMGVWVIVFSIVFAATPYVTRVVYAETKRQRHQDYVVAARSLGSTWSSVAFREILPNVLPTIIVYWTSLIGVLIVFASSLSALGIGVQPPTPDWGRMVAEGSKVLISGSPAVAIIPGIAILLIGLAFNWVGDGLRDILDPHTVAKS
ncbi:MAG: ABC transporter permease [Gordonia sp.]|nr:ABC transporter permease [Gordonia sp. (in: high G+C Gram-positive bacteria)]